MRTCGGCTACCFTHSVMVGSRKKPSETWCTHCECGGCAIYKERPHGCQTFTCLWLQGEIEEARRPDVSGVVMTMQVGGYFKKTVCVYETASGNVFGSEAIASVSPLVMSGYVAILFRKHPHKWYLVLPDGFTLEKDAVTKIHKERLCVLTLTTYTQGDRA